MPERAREIAELLVAGIGGAGVTGFWAWISRRTSNRAERASGVPPRNARDIALEGVFETRKKQYAALNGDLLFDGAEDDL